MTDVNSIDPAPRADFQVTPAAQELLDQYTSLYQSRLLAEATRIAGVEDGESIRLADLRSAELALSRTVEHGSPRSTARLYESVALVLLPILSIGAGLLGSYVTSSDGEVVPLRLAILIALVIGAVALGGAIVALRSQQKSLPGPSDRLALQLDVGELEMHARGVVAEFIDSDLQDKSLSRVVGALEAENVWSTTDAARFRDVMSIRNQFAYEQRTNVGRGELLEASRTIRHLDEALLSFRRSQRSRLGTTSESRSESLEKDVLQALLSFRPSISAVQVDNRYADFLVDGPKSTVAVLVKVRRGRPVRLKDVQDWLDLKSNSLKHDTIVVIDGELTSELVDIGSIQLANGRSVRVVDWRKGGSRSALMRAILRSIDSGSPPADAASPGGEPKSGRFEVYTDSAGRFRFRLRARNGEIVASGQGYSSKSEVLAAIERVQNSAESAAIRDVTA